MALGSREPDLELVHAVRWCTVKNTALRTTFLAAPTPRLRESTGANACTLVCSSSNAIAARMSPGAAVRSENRAAWSRTRSAYSIGKSAAFMVSSAAASISARSVS